MLWELSYGFYVVLYLCMGGVYLKLKDPYKVLGIKTSDSFDTAKASYRKLCMRYHPDRNPGNSEAESKFKEVQDAWAYIKDRIGKGNSEPMWVHGSLFSIIKKGV